MPTIEGTPATETSGPSNSSSSFLTCLEATTSRNVSRASDSTDLLGSARDLVESAKKSQRFTVTPAHDSYSLTKPSPSNSTQADSTIEFEPHATGSPKANHWNFISTRCDIYLLTIFLLLYVYLILWIWKAALTVILNRSHVIFLLELWRELEKGVLWSRNKYVSCLRTVLINRSVTWTPTYCREDI